MNRRLLCLVVALLAEVLFLTPSTPAAASTSPPTPETVEAPVTAIRIVPEPSSLVVLPGQSFTLRSPARIVAPGGAAATGEYLAGLLRPSTGFGLPVTTDAPQPGDIVLAVGNEASLGAEGYQLTVTEPTVELSAHTTAGLFYGVQTLRQLLPPRMEYRSVQSGPWRVRGVAVRDIPRYPWRGAMLDVARHFFTVAQVEDFLDDISMYKINTLHLHLSDNEGWRLEINGWPRLAHYGGSTDGSRGPGGFYTQDDYRAIVQYAATRHVTIIPEIDTPAHSTAALASYAELNCDGVAPPLLDPGPRTLCVPLDITYKYLDDVIAQVAALTPGEYIHVGGDEASNSPAEYAFFMDKMQQIVLSHGKKLDGWLQIETADLTSTAATQYWAVRGSADSEALARIAAQRGNKLIMSSPDHAYLDMKYDPSTPVGQAWAGYVSVSGSYDWDPATFVPGVADAVVGVEAPMWTDLIASYDYVQFMVFPRLAGIAEVGWSPESTHSWDDYRLRLAAQGPRWDALGVNYFRSPEVPWPA
ncbi:beta-N-acetylhexosaminidase [Kutzneria buriramensis]|uniref:beta-N-acetylhexosaminidase n=1 Tax=Kutzneria buriramensis TaxID=1045776 RepID=A0A3E0HFM9_9PSEU|nr:beta-N-acetylhexosaminidase [Kutzneria buriramensis]REH43866.1 hexosaminidase [Kutzneria buriramensis]